LLPLLYNNYLFCPHSRVSVIDEANVFVKCVATEELGPLGVVQYGYHGIVIERKDYDKW